MMVNVYILSISFKLELAFLWTLRMDVQTFLTFFISYLFTATSITQVGLLVSDMVPALMTSRNPDSKAFPLLNGVFKQRMEKLNVSINRNGEGHTVDSNQEK